MNNNNRLYLILIGSIVGLALIYVLASQVIPKTLVTFTKAAPSSKISLGESLMLGEKILARADGTDKCKVNIYVLDGTGKGIVGKRVALEGAEGIDPKEVVSNSEGKAAFSISSNIEKQYDLTAKIEGVELTKSIKVTFRN